MYVLPSKSKKMATIGRKVRNILIEVQAELRSRPEPAFWLEPEPKKYEVFAPAPAPGEL